VKSGVRDFSISRAAVEWGIPIPRDPKQTVYVWFDALNGYLSGTLRCTSALPCCLVDSWCKDRVASTGMKHALVSVVLLRGFMPQHRPSPLGYAALLPAAGLLPETASPDASPEALASAGWPASMHIIGKDILRFHAVYWPAMLLSAGLPPPRRVFGHGFLTKDGLKMGKSLGNVLEPTALVAAYGADAVRYYFLREIVFGQVGGRSEVWAGCKCRLSGVRRQRGTGSAAAAEGQGASG
jgi:methionyl-tRNA synthetase